jgi:hypothetical protein
LRVESRGPLFYQFDGDPELRAAVQEVSKLLGLVRRHRLRAEFEDARPAIAGRAY